jgi:uncharacterized membrane protein YdbT with pleckstrin-like domain
MNTLPMSKHHLRESIALVILRVVVIFSAMGFLFISFLIIFLSNNPFENTPTTILTTVCVYLILNVSTGIFILFFVIKRLLSDYYISEHALVIHKGLFTIEEQIYELKNVYAVKRSQSWWGRIFRYGDLIVNIAAANYQKEIRIHGIQKPKKYEKILEEFISRHKLIPNPPENIQNQQQL